jgi:ketosteroid isomerase-like protein
MKRKESSMATAEQPYREHLHRFVEALNARDWRAVDDLADEVVTSEYVGHLPGAGDLVRGPEGLKQYFRTVYESIPGFHSTIEDVFAAGDKTATRFMARRADPATGKTQRATAIMISRTEGGKSAEDWELVGLWEDEA